MSILKITGGEALKGQIEISGAKNAILAMLAASLLTKQEVIVNNAPNLSDVHIMLELLKELGSDSYFNISKKQITIFAKSDINHTIENRELSEKVRTSSLFLGPILAVKGQVKIPKPGGCKIGARLIDMHLDFFNKMGAEIEETEEYICLISQEKITCVDANFYKNSVGATQNIMMAATLAIGETVISNASLEPENEDLGQFLINMGAKITGLGTSNIRIIGVESLHGAEYSVMHDRIESGTYAIAALITKGEIFLKNAPHQHLQYFFGILKATGAIIKIEDGGVLIKSAGEILSKSICTAPHPYFPTDLQQAYTSLMCVAKGFSIIEENIFNGRFGFVKELEKMNAKIYHKNENKIIVEGVEELIPASLVAEDLRGSMALLMTALATNGLSTINNLAYLERGYEDFQDKLTGVGAQIIRLSNFENLQDKLIKKRIQI